MLSGNKGEWIEIYVLLKLLADGKLYSADKNLNKIKNIFYPIIKILRYEKNKQLEYKLNKHVSIIDNKTNKLLLRMPINIFIKETEELLVELKNIKGRSFSFPKTEKFLKTIKVTTLTAVKSDKSDIRMVVHDLNTGLTPTFGFSIKSMIGRNSTLFNPGNTTNFIYEVIGKDIKKFNISKANKIKIEPKITNKIEYLNQHKLNLEYINIQ